MVRKTLEQVKHELVEATALYSSLLKQIEDQKKLVKDLNEEVKVRTNALTLTDHAILRYLERVEGLDVDSLKKRILSDNIRKVVETIGGDCQVPVEDHSYVIRGGKVVTIIPNE